MDDIKYMFMSSLQLLQISRQIKMWVKQVFDAPIRWDNVGKTVRINLPDKACQTFPYLETHLKVMGFSAFCEYVQLLEL